MLKKKSVLWRKLYKIDARTEFEKYYDKLMADIDNYKKRSDILALRYDDVISHTKELISRYELCVSHIEKRIASLA